MTLKESAPPTAAHLCVGQLARHTILECAPDTPVADAARRMHEMHCGSIIVVDGNGKAVGIWTQRDALGLDLDNPQTLDEAVSRHMSTPVKTIGEGESIQSLTFRFESERVRHLLVVDAFDNRVGVVSQTDVINNQGIEFFVQMRDVGSVMKQKPLTVSGDMSLAEMIAVMRRCKQDAVIVDDHGHFGIFTETDALRLIGARNAAVAARQVASFPLLSITQQSSLYKARALFAERQVRHLGVVDGNELVGLLTYADILVSVEQAYVRELQQALGAQAQELLSSRRTLALAQKVADSTFQGIVITDATGYIESVNPAFTAITGYGPAEVIGRNPRLLKSGQHDDAYYKQMYEALTRHGVWSGEIWNRRKNGETYPCQLTISVVRANVGEITNYVGVFSDLSEQKRYQDDLLQTRRKLEEQEDLNRLMLETLPINAFVKDARGRYLAVNDRAAEFFGFAKDDLIGRSDYEIFPQETAENLRSDDSRVRQLDDAFVKEIRINHRGSESFLLVHKRAVTIGGEQYVIGASVDITERKLMERRLEDERATLGMIARGSDLTEVLDAICVRVERHLHGGLASIHVMDAGGTHLRHGSAPRLAPAYIEALDGIEIGPNAGSCGTAAFTRKPVIVADVGTDVRWEAYRDLAAAHQLRACWSFPVIATDGSVLGTLAIYYHSPRHPSPHELDLIEQTTSLAAIALERAKATELLHRMATVDMLTGIPNRQHFLALGHREIARVQRTGEPLALCMIDIDRFKSINDTHGHAAGDEALKRMAATLAKSLRSADICGRLGGEEFAFLLPETALNDARQVAERLREDVANIAALPVASTAAAAPGPAQEQSITVSIGVCQLRDGESLDQLMVRADAALYKAKRGGRNRVVCL